MSNKVKAAAEKAMADVKAEQAAEQAEIAAAREAAPVEMPVDGVRLPSGAIRKDN